MSSNLYLENELGLILSYNETEKFTETIKEHFPDYISESPDVRNLIESGSLLTKDAISLREVSKIHWSVFRDPATNKLTNIDSSRIYGGCIIKTKRQPSVFKKAYGDTNEIISELKNQIRNYLPDDFDYKKHILLYELILE